MSRVLAVTWLAKSGSEGTIEAILREMIPRTRSEPGCLRYDAFRSSEDPRRFLLVEVYASDEALQAHTSSEYFNRYVGQAQPLLEARHRDMYEPLNEHMTRMSDELRF